MFLGALAGPDFCGTTGVGGVVFGIGFVVPVCGSGGPGGGGSMVVFAPDSAPRPFEKDRTTAFKCLTWVFLVVSLCPLGERRGPTTQHLGGDLSEWF